MKKLMAMVLVLVLSVCLLAGCQSNEQKMLELAGTWELEVVDTENLQMLLDSLALLPEETELVDTVNISDTKCVEFKTDGTYRFFYNVQDSKDSVRAFYEDVFNDLYENRTSLNAAYNMEFDSMSKEDFMQFQAEMYEYESMDQMLDDYAENIFDYSAMEGDMETGTYTLKGNEILCTVTGAIQAERLKYSVSGDKLTLVYIDGTEVYTKAN